MDLRDLKNYRVIPIHDDNRYVYTTKRVRHLERDMGYGDYESYEKPFRRFTVAELYGEDGPFEREEENVVRIANTEEVASLPILFLDIAFEV